MSVSYRVMNVYLKRIYDEASEADGYRVLVDRLWPRGISKERAKLDEWLKDIAPSSVLRTWFGHKPERFDEFSARYEAELTNNLAAIKIEAIAKDHRVVTLLYAAHDPKINHGVVLLKYLQRK